jgi:hypothetical protein
MNPVDRDDLLLRTCFVDQVINGTNVGDSSHMVPMAVPPGWHNTS